MDVFFLHCYLMFYTLALHIEVSFESRGYLFCFSYKVVVKVCIFKLNHACFFKTNTVETSASIRWETFKAFTLVLKSIKLKLRMNELDHRIRLLENEAFLDDYDKIT